MQPVRLLHTGVVRDHGLIVVDLAVLHVFVHSIRPADACNGIHKCAGHSKLSGHRPRKDCGSVLLSLIVRASASRSGKPFRGEEFPPGSVWPKPGSAVDRRGHLLSCLNSSCEWSVCGTMSRGALVRCIAPSTNQIACSPDYVKVQRVKYAVLESP